MERQFAGRVVHPAGDGIVYGAGSLAAELAGLVERLGMRRPFIVTTGSVERAGLVDDVVAAVGVEIAGTFAGSREHTPVAVVIDAADQARAAGADGLISVGGSSVVDLTKGIALVVSDDAAVDGDRLARRPVLDLPKMAHLAVPTTLSGAEFTPAAGITDTASGVKRGYMHPSLAPRWVVLDPLVTRATPVPLWAATGMKALADTIEVICSTRATPLSDAIARGALAQLVEHLPASTRDPDDLDARGRCQFAVAMILGQIVGVGLGLVAALRHQLGGGLGVGHGVASTIVLAHVVRWNAPSCERALIGAATAAGVGGIDELLGRLEAMTTHLDLPTRLRDVDVERESLPGVAEHVLADVAVRTNPRPVSSVDDVLEILAAAF